MSIARVFTAQPGVLTGNIVTIETDLSRGLHSFVVVGLPGKAVEEAKDRVSAAIKNSGFKSPKSKNHKIIVSLSPADLKKDGPLFDLPMAISYLLTAAVMQADLSKTILLGELALDGTLRGVRGVLPAVQVAKRQGFTEIIVPVDNASEAALVDGITIRPAKSLLEVVCHLDTTRPDYKKIESQGSTIIKQDWLSTHTRLEDVKGQETAKRGLIIAAAGRHNAIMVGPPGTGKTMLARTFQGLLPPLSHSEALEVMGIHSLVGAITNDITSQPPFRAPHHTASHTSLVGGGVHPRPGEVTLAHKGVLFMDEFPEFERRSIDALRQPLEDRVVAISRIQGTALFPADFILLAAMNPYRGSEDGTTDYAASMLDTYKNKVSGPILDRIDLWLEVPHIPYDTLTSIADKIDETTPARALITRARARQSERLLSCGISTNANMTARDLDEIIKLSDPVRNLLKTSAQKLNLSPRSYHRLIKVSRTIADLADNDDIGTTDVLEALQYRVKL